MYFYFNIVKLHINFVIVRMRACDVEAAGGYSAGKACKIMSGCARSRADVRAYVSDETDVPLRLSCTGISAIFLR